MICSKIKRRMKIWHYTTLNPSGLGGVETHIASVSRELLAMGHDVRIGASSPNWSPNDECVIHTHGDAWPTTQLIKQLTIHKRARLIHIAHGTSLGRLLACREYISVSGWKGSLRDFLPSRLAHGISAVSHQVEHELRRYFRVKKPIRVIPNGVDPASFTAVKEISSSPRVAFVGRGDDRVKNVESLIQACRQLSKTHSDLELWAIPGFNAYNDPFISNRGRKNAQALSEELAQCRALALVSFYESDGIVLREAQALGIPVIASRTPSLEQNLAGYSNAVFIDPRSVSSIADGIEKLLYLSPSLVPLPRMRSWRQVAKELLDFYDEIIQSK